MVNAGILTLPCSTSGQPLCPGCLLGAMPCLSPWQLRPRRAAWSLVGAFPLPSIFILTTVGTCLSVPVTKRYHLLLVQLLVRRGCP